MNLLCQMMKNDTLTQTEQHLRDYVLTYPEKAAQMNTRQLAEASFTSPAAVVRFCQKLGYKGLAELKAELYRPQFMQMAAPAPDYNFPFAADSPAPAVTEAMLSLEIDALQKLRALLDPADIARAVALLLASEEIDLVAVGTSLQMGQEFAFRMLKLGRRVNVPQNNVDMGYFCKQINDRHCVVLMSYCGVNRAVRMALKAAKAGGAPVIAVTGRMEGIAAKGANVVLPLPGQEDDGYKIAPFASATAEKALLDILYAHLYQKDYAHNCAVMETDAARLKIVRMTEE